MQVLLSECYHISSYLDLQDLVTAKLRFENWYQCISFCHLLETWPLGHRCLILSWGHILASTAQIFIVTHQISCWIAVTACTDLFNQFLDMTANIYGYNLDYDPFYAMGTFEATIYNRVRADLRARGIRNFTDPYYGDDSNSPRTDDRYTNLNTWTNDPTFQLIQSTDGT